MSTGRKNKTSISISITEELTTEILFRLPVKSVARFKCVSKNWNRLISDDPYFRKNYRDAHGSPFLLGFFYHQNYSEIRFLPMFDQRKFGLLTAENEEEDTRKSILNFLGDQHLFLIASSNGFLLLSPQGRSEAWNYIVCNPITKQWMNLSPPNHITGKFYTIFIWKSFNNFCHFKVLRSKCSQSPFPFYTTLTIEIFDGDSNGHGQWKEFNLSYIHPFSLRTDCDMAMISEKSGFVYWPANIDIPDTYKLNTGLLVFDLNRQEEHQLEIIPFPPKEGITSEGGLRSQYQCRRFGQSNGLIVSVIHTFRDLYFWVLDEEKRSWYLQYKIENFHESVIHLIAFHPFHPHLVFMGMGDGSKAFLNLETEKVQESFSSSVQVESFYFPYTCPSWPPALCLFR